MMIYIEENAVEMNKEKGANIEQFIMNERLRFQ